mgnify:FL=1
MGVNLVIGRSGTGKTEHCLRDILRQLEADPLGPPIHWIVPDQATFVLERRLMAASPRGGFSRCRIVSFELLAQDILAQAGGAAVPQVTPLGRQMILGHLLRRFRGELRYFDRVVQHASLASCLDTALAELERGGATPDQLQAAINGLSRENDADAQALADKLHDLHLLFCAYGNYLGQERLDPWRRMRQVLDCLAGGRWTSAGDIYVDGFFTFTEWERRLLAGLAQTCPQLTLTLLMDPDSPALDPAAGPPDELSCFHRVERAWRRLREVFLSAGVQINAPLLLRQQHRLAAPCLSHVEARLFAPGRQADVASDQLDLVEAPNRRAEVDAAARHIRGLLAQGMRLRDILVLARNLDDYRDLIAASFAEHGIRFFADRRRSMAHHPLLQLLRSALAVAQLGWPRSAVMAIARSGLAGLSPDDADQLENYLLAHRIEGEAAWTQAQPWKYGALAVDDADPRQPTAPAECQLADALRRRITAPLSPFVSAMRSSPTQPLRKLALAVFDLLDRLDVRGTLAAWIDAARAASQHERADEHQQVWTQLTDLFEQMVELLGDEPVSAADFAQIVETGLEGFTLALAPPTLDEVLVGQVDRTRPAEAKACLVLGLNEGTFPRSHRDAAILSDTERLRLEKARIQLDDSSERRLLDEDLLAYYAFTRASQRLYLSRPLADDAGKKLGPSPYWVRTLEIVPRLRPQQLPDDTRLSPAHIGTPAQLVAAILHWAREGGDSSDTTWPAAYQFLAERAADDSPLHQLCRRAWTAMAYRNDARLSRNLAARLFASPLPVTVSQLETAAACPFKHFVRYGLRLAERPDPDPTFLDMDSIFSRALGRIGAHIVRAQGGYAVLSPPQARKLAEDHARAVAEVLRDQILLSTGRNRHLLEHIQRSLEQVLNRQAAIAQRGTIRPAFASLRFGRGHRAEAARIDTPAGPILLEGRIDRVDISDDGSAFVVFDYRMNEQRFDATRVYHGLTLQLLAGLLIMQARGRELSGRELAPAAALYLRLLEPLQRVAHPSDVPDPSDPNFHLRHKLRGLIATDRVATLDRQLISGASEFLSVQIKKDGEFSRHNADLADPHQLKVLLDHVLKRIAELGRRILDGQVVVTPYRLGTESACARCSYQSVCRFEPGLNRYNVLPHITREQLLGDQPPEAGNER